MANNALYRRFRPIRFDELMGQDYITKILKNQIINDRIGHAYLFSGSRGTGKTSTAKIFSRAINCLNPQNGEPCNECEICKGIMNERITDIVEMDAASNNGVDNIRNIRDEVVYLPTQAKYKVYIIDEVHMLSTGAFNALLKTLEEPPKNVVFILATTEAHKLPVTILSRLQKFEFRKIPEKEIVEYLQKVLDEIEAKVDDKALGYIAYLADGGMRDALSILERCLNDTLEVLTYDDVRNILGMSSTEKMLELISGLADYDSIKVISAIDSIIEAGKDLRNYIDQSTNTCIDIYVYKLTGKLAHYAENEEKLIREIVQKVSMERIQGIIDGLSAMDSIFRQSTNPLIMVKSRLIAMNNIKANDDNSALIQRIEKLEADIKNWNIKASKEVNVQETNKERNKTVKTKNEEATSLKTETVTISKGGHKEYFTEWNDIKREISKSGKMKLFASLVQVDAFKLSESEIGLTFKTDYAKKILEDRENNETISQVIEDITGKRYSLKLLKESNDETSKESKFEKMCKDKNINYIIEEE